MCKTKEYIQKAIRLTASFLCILLSSKLMAQRNSYYEQIKQINESGAAPVKSSMAYSLDSPVNTLTGAACFDIPIYTIKTGGYTMPISLHYETSGFRVATIASNVGLGWNLNAGGCITKTIKGFNDNISGVGYCAQDNQAVNIHNAIRDLAQEDYLNNEQTYIEDEHCNTLIKVTDKLYDSEPDIYSFNFAGYSGNFIFDMDNNIHLIPEQNFDIQKTESGFVITVDNGDKYYFGESESSREIVQFMYNCPLVMKVSEFEANTYQHFQYRYYFNSSNSEWDNHYPIKWFLTKIEIAQTQKQIIFEYETDDVRTYLGTDESYMRGQTPVSFSNPTLTENNDWVVHRINRYSFSFIPRLKRIIWNNGKIDFVSSSDFREDLDYFNYNHNEFGGRKVERIVVSSMEESEDYPEHYSVDLNLSYFTDMHADPNPTIGYPNTYLSYYKRLRLDGIIFNDLYGNPIFHYNFLYNTKSPSHCFSRNTSQVDYWGYLKPREHCFEVNIERFLIKPTIYYYENGKENPLYNSVYSVWKRSGDTQPTYVFEGNSDMTPDLTGSKEFTLKEVTLPTSEKVRFDYELNSFFFDNQIINGPGVRVKTVHYGSNNNSSDFVEDYRKEYSYNDGNYSSGRVTNIPAIGVRNLYAECNGGLLFLQDDEDGQNRKTARQFSTVTDMGTTCESLVQYEQVTEACLKSNASMGKTVYRYQLNLTAADSELMVDDEVFIKKTDCRWSYNYHCSEVCVWNGFCYPCYTAENVDNTPFFTQPIYNWYNGYLISKEFYNQADRLVESIEYNYSMKPSDVSIFYIQSKYLCKYASVLVIPEFTELSFTYNYSFPCYFYDFLWGVNYYKTGVRQLDAIIHKYYSEDDGNLVNTTTTTFEYNTNNYVSEEMTENSDGSVIKQTYSYPNDYASWHPNDVYGNMIDRNMYNSIVEQYTSIDDKVVQGLYSRFNMFGLSNQFIKPEKLFKLRTNIPLTNFQPTVSQTGQDSHYELTNEMQYDPTSGNLVEVWDENDGTTAYVWGFHNSLLLAKIQNATDSEVRNALICTVELLQEKTDTEELIEIFQALRAALPNAMVTSYTYDLFQNLVSITDPSGKTSRYEYDDALRLKLTRDVENNILQKYEYHYYDQQTE